MASLKTIWRDRCLTLPIKIRTHKALVLSTLLTGSCTLQRHGPCAPKMPGPSRASTWNANVRYSASDGRISNEPDWLTAIHAARCQTPQLLFLDTLPGCHTLSQLTRLYTVKLSCHSADYPTRRGSVVQVAPTSDGWTRFATTTTVHPLTCGEMLSNEVILERRNGPRRLSDNDDDDDNDIFVHSAKTAQHIKMFSLPLLVSSLGLYLA